MSGGLSRAFRWFKVCILLYAALRQECKIGRPHMTFPDLVMQIDLLGKIEQVINQDKSQHWTLATGDTNTLTFEYGMSHMTCCASSWVVNGSFSHCNSCQWALTCLLNDKSSEVSTLRQYYQLLLSVPKKCIDFPDEIGDPCLVSLSPLAKSMQCHGRLVSILALNEIGLINSDPVGFRINISLGSLLLHPSEFGTLD